jgi:hypothetical protein
MNPGGLFVSSSGLIGIGTINPANFLHINGLNPNLIIQNTTSSVGSESNLTFRSTFGNGDIAYLGYIRAIQQSTTQNTGDIAIHAYSTGSANEVIRIQGASGNVGIGTTNPNYASTNRKVLAIDGSSSALYAIQNAGTSAGYVYGDSTSIVLWAEGTRNLTVGVAGAGAISLNTNNTPRLYVTSGGSVGIGTISPNGAYTLTMDGNTSTRLGGISFRQSGVDTFYIGNPTVTNNTDFELWNPRSGYLRFATNNIERMRIDSNGLISAPYLTGKYFDMTSGTGTGTAIMDTGIFVGSGDWGGFGRSTVYLVTFIANPNNGGSGEYSASHVGYINVYTGWSGSNVTTYIGYTQLAVGNNISTLTLSPTFWNGSTESGAVTRASISGWQIRIKISGYNSSFTGANQALYITKIITSG